MTQKAPQQPKTAKVAVEPTQQFWNDILEIQKAIAEDSFGVAAGKGGSALKDSSLLKLKANKLLSEKSITYDVVAEDDVTAFLQDNLFFVYGHYAFVWFQNGIEVYQGRTFGGFSSVVSPSTNLSYAIHGALTSANTDVLFTMLKANVISEEDLEAKQQSAAQRQEPRSPATTGIYNNDSKPY